MNADALPVLTLAPETVSRARFLAEVAYQQARLPQYFRYAINLCRTRRHFLAAFAAVMQKGQTNLLANNDKAGTLAAIAASYPQSYFILDDAGMADSLPQDAVFHVMQTPETEALPAPASLVVAPEHEAVVTFTSGSTGAPMPWPKPWRMLEESTRLAAQRFGMDAAHPATLVATVPHQHMYGLETITLLALQGFTTASDSQPFYPADIQRACAAAFDDLPENGRVVLVTTPIHLRSLVADGTDMPPLHRIISATAPLSVELAAEAERLFDTQVHEIYGCTEAGSIASRRTTRSESWKPYAGYHLTEDENGQAFVSAAHLPHAIALGDHITLTGDGTFLLAGRREDMLNIGGKRASLAGLNALLQKIPSIRDGVFVQEAAADGREARLTLLVVPHAPQQWDRQELLSILAQEVDAVFLPRRIHTVEALPRNATGKLQRAELEQLLLRLKGVCHAE